MSKSKIVLGLLSSLFILSGCTKMYNSNEVDIHNTNVEMSYQKGIITDIKYVKLKDDGSGTAIGAGSGFVIGSMFGHGKGNLLATLFGTIVGGYAGYQADKANGMELFIKLDNGKEVVVIVKNNEKFKPGDKVRIIKNGYKIIRVEKYN